MLIKQWNNFVVTFNFRTYKNINNYDVLLTIILQSFIIVYKINNEKHIFLQKNKKKPKK